MDKSAAVPELDQRPAQQLLEHTLDSKLWVDQNGNEDDFYSNLGDSFDYQPDPIAERKIDSGFLSGDNGLDPLNPDHIDTKNAFISKAMMRPGLRPAEEDHVKIGEDSDHQRTTLQYKGSSKEQTSAGGIYPSPSKSDDPIDRVLQESELATQKWNQIVLKCDEHFASLQQQVQAGLESFQKSVETIGEAFSKMTPQIVDQLRMKAQLGIEEGEGKVQVGQRLRAMLVDVHRIAKSFEESMNMRR